MARKPTVNYWPSRKGGGYFCNVRGERYELALGPDDAPEGPTYLLALERFTAILKNADRPASVNVAQVLDTYIEHIKEKAKPGTVEIRERSYHPFINYRHERGKRYGERSVEELTHQDIYRFLDHMAKVPRRQVRKKEQRGRKPSIWGLGSQRNCVLGLNAAFNWAAKSGVIKKNPLVGIDKPSAASRGAESLLGKNADEIEKNHRRILGAVPASYAPFLQALKDTGARPGEIIAATGADFDPDLGAFVFHKEMTRRSNRFSHKTAKLKDRVIFLSGQTLEHVKTLLEKYQAGPLFRRKGDRPFQKFHIIDRFTKLQRKLKMPTLTAYSYRHTFATEMLKAGCDVDSLAELMGNSPTVIREHYSHLLADKKGLRSKLERFRPIQTASA